jgi:type I restriction enzyme S subunit
MAVENLITDYLDIWTSAIKTKSAAGRGSSKKLELVGIKKLRELILELAVRGKLVPQDPNDEPASELLKKIEDEKARLVTEGHIKKQKPLPSITEEEKPFKLPEGWAYERIGNLVSRLGSGSTPRGGKNAYVDTGIPFFRSQNIWNDGIKLNDVAYITEEIHEQMSNTKVIPDDVLLNITGASLGRSTIFPKELIEANVSQHVTIIRLIETGMNNFLHLGILSPLIQKLVWGRQVGMAIEGLSKKVLELFEFPVPPLKEQHRIVEKVDELMVLCDQLEAQTEASIDAHKTLVEVLLATLSNAKDADELNDNWQTISQHFDVLFTTQASIDQLKQTILQLAVMGKLVKQDPKDEPASKLLERIATEKQQLIKDKKIKKQTLLPAITDEKKPFEIPTGWSYTRLDDLCANVFSGSTPPKSELNETSGIPFLKVYNIQNQELEFEKRTLFVSANSHTGKLKRSILYPGDVVLNLVGPPLGKVAIMPNTYPEWNCNQNIICFRPLEIKLNRYIYTYLKAHIFLDYIDLVGSAGQDFISGAKCRAIVLPTPPLAEQQRIVAKVEELMTLCDSLKTRLNQAQTIQLHLTDAIVEQAL